MYLYVMDSICKNVQGEYLRQFGSNIRFMMHLILQRQQQIGGPPDDRGRKLQKLVKIFKTWEVLELFDPRELNNIADSLNLRPLVRKFSIQGILMFDITIYQKISVLNNVIQVSKF